jgi:hypothetical protein
MHGITQNGSKLSKKTGRKTLIIAGTLTSVCMALPTLSALEAGYKVFCVIDASGNHSKMATELTTARVTQAGAHPIDTFAVESEIMATWNRDDAWEFAGVMMDHIVPVYRTLADFTKKQEEQGASSQMKSTAQGTPDNKDLMMRLGKITSGVQMTTSQT